MSSRHVLRNAKHYARKGWRLVPIPRKEKAPRLNGWQKLRLDESDVPKYFDEHGNLGVLLGKASNGLVDIDLDCDEAMRLASDFLPETQRIHGRRSKPLSHYWYYAAPVPAPQKFSDIDGSCLVELRSTGEQTVLPPSRHPTGEQLHWHTRKRTGRVSDVDLVRSVRRLAAAALIARHWPVRGTRHEVTLALAGTLLRGGMDEREVEDFILLVAEAAGDEESDKRKSDVRSTRKRLDEDEPATGRAKLADLLGAPVVEHACEWLGLNARSHTAIRRLQRHQVPWPAPLAEEAFHGLPGQILRVIAPETEADPAGLLVQSLAGFGNLVGSNVYFQIGATRHHTNLFVGLVGRTAKSRKGTSWNECFRLLRQIDPIWARERLVPGGLSSGEGLIWSVRDEEERSVSSGDSTSDELTKSTQQDDGREEADLGVDDKRLMVVETEFASTLRVMRREGNILSSVVRTAWDSGDLNNLTKNSPARSTGAHISIITHITIEELRREMSATETANGFANRYLWPCVHRVRLLPFGGNADAAELTRLSLQLRRAVTFARVPRRMEMSKHARRKWRKLYPSLAADVPGLLGAVTSRAEAQVLRLAMIYALMDCSRLIGTAHLSAALAVWHYCEESARYIFGDALGDVVADTILRELRRHPDGMTRTEIREIFKRNRSEAEISRALNVLLEDGWVSCSIKETGGRPAERWAATH